MRKPLSFLTLISMLFTVPVVRADDHLVTRGAVKQKLTDAAVERTRNLASVDRVLASPRAARTAAKARIDLAQVRTSLPVLNDTDLRDLAQRAAALDSNPVAGHYRDAEDALVFVIVISAAALVLIAVADRA